MVQFFYGFCLLLHDSLDRAEVEFDKALALARRAGEIGHQARCMTYVALLARRRGLLEETEQYTSVSLELSSRCELREYVAASWANQGWVALRRGELDIARGAAERAFEAWQQLTAAFPFHWLALLPLLEIDLARGRLKEAIQRAEGLLAPAQHALPAGGLRALHEAVATWEIGDHQSARHHLDAAVDHLKSHGYS
jgi:tetratricopeptide (TPR) repeat protein